MRYTSYMDVERLDCVELSVAVNKNFGCSQAPSSVQGEAKPGGRGSLRGHEQYSDF